MTEEEIKKVVFSILKNIAPDTEPEKLKMDDNIRETLTIDSFDYLRFIVDLDKKFNSKIPEEDYGKIQRLNELVSYILTSSKNEIKMV